MQLSQGCQMALQAVQLPPAPPAAPACHAPANAVSVLSSGCVTASWSSFVCVSLVAYEVEHFCTFPGYSDVLFCEDPSLTHFSSGLSVLFLLICRSTLYILDTGPVLDGYITNIIPGRVGGAGVAGGGAACQGSSVWCGAWRGTCAVVATPPGSGRGLGKGEGGAGHSSES